jgi:hypothetical protein
VIVQLLFRSEMLVALLKELVHQIKRWRYKHPTPNGVTGLYAQTYVVAEENQRASF